MKLSEDELLAVAFIFEQRNGNENDDWETAIINQNSHLTNLDSETLKNKLIEDLDNGAYNSDEERIQAYWVLSKANDKKLVKHFRKWLEVEFGNLNSKAVYQILIALQNFNETVFSRTSTSIWEEELNMLDARIYLKNYA